MGLISNQLISVCISSIHNGIQISWVCLIYFYDDNSAQASSPVYIRDFHTYVTTHRKVEMLALIEGVNELGCTEYA